MTLASQSCQGKKLMFSPHARGHMGRGGFNPAQFNQGLNFQLLI